MSKSRKRLKKALLAGAALYGASKLMKPGVSDAKAMKASDMNKRRVPAFIKKRGAGMDGAFLPKPPKGKGSAPPPIPKNAKAPSAVYAEAGGAGGAMVTVYSSDPNERRK